MIDTPEARLLAALARAAETLFGAGHPVAVAADGAAQRAAFDAAPAADRDRILAEAHRLMREDLAAIWSFLPGASGQVH